MPQDLGLPLDLTTAVFDLRAHPAAELFPMLGDIELAELAEDIKANGLINPIMLDASGECVIDGRNRLAACRMAGVEPRFETYSSDDPVGYVVSLNVKRRNLTKQQLAISAARAWKQAEDAGLVAGHGGDRKSSGKTAHLIAESRSHFGRLFGVSAKYADMARRVLDYSPELAEQVARASISLELAYDQATQADRKIRQGIEAKERLSEIAPDLVERIDRSEITVAEAQAIFNERDAELREIRRTLFQKLHDFTKWIPAIAGDPRLLDVPMLLGVQEYELEFRAYFKGGHEELQERLARLREAVSVLEKLGRDLPRKGRHK